MSWLFCYFVEPRYGIMYRDPEPWFNVKAIMDACPNVVFHTSETHVLHNIGAYLKNFGLRTCMIIEATSDADACMLRMMEDEIVVPQSLSSSKPPSLQLILQDPDFDELLKLSEPLLDYKKGDARRRENVKAITVLQKHNDRTSMALSDLDSSLSSDFLEQATIFMDVSHQEVERLQMQSRIESRKATAARKVLCRKLLSYSTFAK